MYIQRHSLSAFILIVVLLGFTSLSGCDVMEGLAGSVIDIDEPTEPNRNNPLDKSGANYVEPEVSITAYLPGTNTEVPESSAIDTHTVDFAWVGSPDTLLDRMVFRYRFDNSAWSDWAKGNGEVSYRYLDDREYQFDVQVKYVEDDQSQNEANTSVSIDAIKGPAVTYWPRSHEVYSPLDTIDVEIYLDEVQNIAGFKSILNYDPNKLKVESVEAYSNMGLLAGDGGEVLFLEGPHEASDEYVMNFLRIDGSPENVSGSGPVARIQFVVLETADSNTSIRFSNQSTLRSADNQNYPLRQFVTKPIGIQ
ncbi:MAG: cohesin domain-containing protein [Bacteroidota bacterium]